MKSWITPMLAVVLLLVLGTTGNAVEPSGPRDAAIDAIITLGGEIRFDGAAVSGAGGGGVEAVRLDRTGVTDAGLVHLKVLTNVKTISLRFTKVTGDGFAHFKGLTNLTSLYLPGSTVRDIGLERLKNVPTLVNLYLQETQITDVGLAHLAGLKNLRILYLDGTKISDAGLEHLKGLKLAGLYLHGTAVTDAGLEHLTGMSNLKFLTLTGTKVTDAGVKKLRQALPNCQISEDDRQRSQQWDQAREIFYVRRFPTGETYEHPHAFAPPWYEYHPFVHDAAFYDRVVGRLEAVEKLPAAEMEGQAAPRRLIFLRDLWPVFDGLSHARVEISGDKEATSKAVVRRDDLLRRVARIMRRLELSGEEVRALPSALTTLRDKKTYPKAFDPASPDEPFFPTDLLDKDGPWVAYSRDKAPSVGGKFHVEFVRHRSIFTLHLRTPNGRDEAVKYLEDFRKNNASEALPTGSTLALLRRALVPTRDGKIIPSPFVESLQLIAVTKTFDIRLKFTLDRNDVLAGGTGLKRIGKDDPIDPSSFESIFSYNRVMPIPPPPPTFPPTESLILGQYKSVRQMPRSLSTCVECHGEVTRANIFGANFEPKPKIEAYVQPTDLAQTDATVVKIKEASEEWKSYLRLRDARN